MVNYVLAALSTFYSFRRGLKEKQLEETRHPIQYRQFWKVVVAEVIERKFFLLVFSSSLSQLFFYSISLFGVRARGMYPNVKIDRGIVYEEENKMKLDVFYPAEFDRSVPLFPVLLYVHGGSWVGGNRKGFQLFFFLSFSCEDISCLSFHQIFHRSLHISLREGVLQ